MAPPRHAAARACGEAQDGLQRASMDPLSRRPGTADVGGPRARRSRLPQWPRWRMRCPGHASHGRRSSSQGATAGRWCRSSAASVRTARATTTALTRPRSWESGVRSIREQLFGQALDDTLGGDRPRGWTWPSESVNDAQAACCWRRCLVRAQGGAEGVRDEVGVACCGPAAVAGEAEVDAGVGGEGVHRVRGVLFVDVSG